MAVILAGEDADPFLEELAEHRVQREAGLRAEYGWLSLTGLYWLEPGPNSVGGAATSAVVLPGATAAVGSLVYQGGTVTLEPLAGVALTVNDEAATGPRVLRDDGEGQADVVQVGRVRFHVIERGQRHGVRVKDPDNPVRTSFRGLDWFAPDPSWRVTALLKRFAEPQEVPIRDIVGTDSKLWAPGVLEFEVGGRKLSLLPLVGEPADTELFIMFRDESSGVETYGAGRYLAANLEGETAVLDFNRAYNPPCAFTQFATCPLPPRENRLPIRVAAGERTHGEH
jgi:uncharacterized protein (DUF1684 family)